MLLRLRRRLLLQCHVPAGALEDAQADLGTVGCGESASVDLNPVNAALAALQAATQGTASAGSVMALDAQVQALATQLNAVDTSVQSAATAASVTALATALTQMQTLLAQLNASVAAQSVQAQAMNSSFIAAVSSVAQPASSGAGANAATAASVAALQTELQTITASLAIMTASVIVLSHLVRIAAAQNGHVQLSDANAFIRSHASHASVRRPVPPQQRQQTRSRPSQAASFRRASRTAAFNVCCAHRRGLGTVRGGDARRQSCRRVQPLAAA